jgi:hypothetical protein
MLGFKGSGFNVQGYIKIGSDVPVSRFNVILPSPKLLNL